MDCVPQDRMVTIGIDSARETLWQPRAMPPIDLNVPFYEKDDAKRMGTRWDAAAKDLVPVTWHGHRAFHEVVTTAADAAAPSSRPRESMARSRTV